MRRGGKSEAGSGSIWLPRWSDLLNHLVTGSIPYTYHGRHENNKGFFLPRVITPPKRMFTRSTISPPLFVAPPLALRFSYLYDYILLNCSKGELIQLERENSRWRKTEEKRGRKEEFYEQDGNNVKFTIAPRHFAGRQQAAKTK